MEKNGLDRGKIKAGMIGCLLISLFSLYDFFRSENLVENNDLTTISGQLENYEFETYRSGHRSNLKHYVVKLENSSDTYQIRAGDIWLFKKSSFIDETAVGENIRIEIPEKKEKYKLENGNIPVYGISKSDKVYLNSKEVLRENRAPTSLLISIIMMLAAISLFFLYLKQAQVTAAAAKDKSIKSHLYEK